MHSMFWFPVPRRCALLMSVIVLVPRRCAHLMSVIVLSLPFLSAIYLSPPVSNFGCTISKRQSVTDVWCFRAPLDPLQSANPPSHLEQTNLDMSSIQPTSRLYIVLLPLSRFPRRPKNFLSGRTGLAGANRSNVLARVGRA